MVVVPSALWSASSAAVDGASVIELGGVIVARRYIAVIVVRNVVAVVTGTCAIAKMAAANFANVSAANVVNVPAANVAAMRAVVATVTVVKGEPGAKCKSALIIF